MARKARPERHLGKKFGRLEVVSYSHKKILKNGFSGPDFYLCKCNCGNEKVVNILNLLSGNTISCGCYNKEIITLYNKKHGLSKHHLMGIWGGIIKRCTNKKCKAFKHYGGRGIVVCKEWKTFINFYSWAIANGWEVGKSIDRTNNNGNYEPNNCRFITQKEQCNNTRSNVFLTFMGVKKTMKQWCDELNKPYGAIRGRIVRGWSTEDALAIPISSSNRYYSLKQK